MQNLLKAFKEYNSKHKKMVPFLIYFEIAAIIVASIFGYIRRHFKMIAAIALVIVIVVFASRYMSASKNGADNAVEATAVEETEEVSEIVAKNVEVGSASDERSEEGAGTDDKNDSMSEVITEDKSTSIVDTNNKNDIVSEREGKDEANSDGFEETSLNPEEKIVGFIGRYPETVAWIRFEDERINYPVMQAEDNSKYSIKDYEGNDSNTGALFLDYRSSADFSDPNSIIYGHNMRDRTMFGALKIYKENLSFLKDHKYFQIITPVGSTRYMIFAFMDVKKDSYLYDVCGPAPDNMRSFLDTIEYKTYIDTGIEPSVDDKIITLSTCTKSDDLFFVMFAVKVD